MHDFGCGSNFLASISANNLESGNSGSFDPAISGDGRFVAFASYATNLVANDTNNVEVMFCARPASRLNHLVSRGAGGSEGNGSSYWPQISANGRYVLFFSAANNIVAGAGGEFFWSDLTAEITYAVGATNLAAMTPDGSNVVFAVGAQLHLWQPQNQSNSIITTVSGLGAVKHFGRGRESGRDARRVWHQ